MEAKNETNAVVEAKLHELQNQEEKVKELQAQLAQLNTKVQNKEELSSDDTKFISELGWLSTLSVTIATIAASL
ncbi:MAG: hypothetical protein R8K20_03150 [Gallionellaceae bacterium]